MILIFDYFQVVWFAHAVCANYPAIKLVWTIRMRKIEKLFWSVYVLHTKAEKVFNFRVVERTGTAVKEWEHRCTACKAAFFVVKYANFVNFLSHEKRKKETQFVLLFWSNCSQTTYLHHVYHTVIIWIRDRSWSRGEETSGSSSVPKILEINHAPMLNTKK